MQFEQTLKRPKKISSSVQFSAKDYDLGNRKSRVLLLEAAKNPVPSLDSILTEASFDVSKVLGLRRALSAIEKIEFSCVICNHQISDCSPEIALPVLRRALEDDTIPLVVVTSKNSGEELNLLGFGADMYCLRKDASESLVKQVRFLLN